MDKLKTNQFFLNGHIITEIPLLFQTEMVQATIADRKTQTRRTKGLSLNINPHLKKEWKYTRCYLGPDTKDNLVWMADARNIPTGKGYGDICPYGKPGDLLWVRETWAKLIEHYKDGSLLYQPEGFKYVFKADGVFMKSWKPSIHMPKAACRLWLMVEEIRVERVQDISEADAVAEGIESQFIHLFQELRYRCYSSKNKTPYQGFPQHWASNWREPISSFQSLWISINGKASWDANLWVWVVKFRVLSKTGRPSDEVILENWKEVSNV